MNTPVNPDIANIINPPNLSLGQLLLHADPVVQAVILVLLIFSIWSWAVMVQKAFELHRAKRTVSKLEIAIENGQTPDEIGVDESHPAALLIQVGVREAQSLPGSKTQESQAEERERIERSMRNALSHEMRRIQKRLPVLATVGSVAVFIGLFGTVWGIMNSFTAIAQAHDTSLAVVAPGIAQALIGTAAGLVAAIPAVIGYNKFVTEMGYYAGRLQTLISTCGGLLVKGIRGEGD
ncbi:MAG: MotA/TolQ/ExbB proton channel family protein [Gammaproteobacteria bacterium]